MKVAVVTGASGGIGCEIVKELINNGYFVLCQYNTNVSKLNKLKIELEKVNLAGFLALEQADFCCLDEVESFANKVFLSFKHVDAFINCAGVELYKLLQDTSKEEIQRVMNVNFNSAYLLSTKMVKSMVSRGCGNIVYISSVWGNVGASMETLYSASKSALIGLTKSLAKEVAIANVRVNCVCPGVIDTPMNDCFSSQEKSDLVQQIPAKRFGLPSEIAKLVCFLCSNRASYITGQVITSDGGFTL